MAGVAAQYESEVVYHQIREDLESQGVIFVDTDTADVITGPKIDLNAVAEDESEFDKVRHQIVEQLQDAMMQGTRDTYKLQQIMRRTLGGWVARQLHRKPMIVPVVADIAQDVDDAMGLNAAK